MDTASVALPERKGLNWTTFTAFAVFHAGAIAALFFFSWTAFWTAFALNWIALSWGIGMGYHRLHTHRGYKCSKAFEYFMAICATLSLEGGPIFWVGTHRIHHQLSDKAGDPHSPRDGAWWSHILWMVIGRGLPQQDGADGPVCSRPCARPVLPLAEHLSLGAADRRSASLLLAFGGIGRGALGHLSPRDARASLYMAG